MLGIKLSDVISLKFWFSMNPGPLSPKFQTILLWFFAAILAAAVVFKVLTIIRKKDFLLNNIWRKFYRLCLIMGLIGFLLLFFFYEGVPVLGSRFLFLVWISGFIIWLIYILIYLFRGLPKIKRESEEKKQFEKYLPRSNKSR